MNDRRLEELGYQFVRDVPGQGACGLMKMLFTTGLFVHLDDAGWGRRYCYAEFEQAREALAAWNGEGDPPGLWIKEKPSERRGPGATDDANEATNRITVQFTCHKCGLKKVRVRVPLRAAGEDIADWIKAVGQRCGDRHCVLSPQCDERKVDLMIPMPAREGDGIGTSARDEGGVA